MTRAALPIDAVLPDLLAALSRHANVVLAAPPGAGKTTGVPLALLDQPWAQTGRLLMLEPRRVAARAAAERLATHLGEPVGQSVGYRIRGESRTSRSARIEVVTEGILTRMLQSDPDLPGIAAILFDEVHERSVQSDLGLALSLEVQDALRPDLKVLAMSATLDTGLFSALLGDAPVIESAGRSYQVETLWLDRPWRKPADGRRGLEAAMLGLITSALASTEGDILAFLPGAGEINRLAALIARAHPGLVLCPLFGALPMAEQRKALSPHPDGQRRIVLATSIAETSLTVPGVRVVIDSGFSRRARVDPATGLSRLVTVPVSRAEADQRRGRAGRVAPGTCYRLWTRGEEGALPPFAPPEITETDLAPLALELALWGIQDTADLRFLTPPPATGYQAARALLNELGALDPAGRITPHGRAMAGHPLHPRLAHMLIAAATPAETATAALIAALLSEGDPMRALRQSDLGLRLRALGRKGRPDPALAPASADRIRREARRLDRGTPDPDAAGPVLARAYPDRIALRRPGDDPRYLLSGGRGAVMDAADPLAGQRLLVAADLEDGREARIRLAAPISEADLRRTLGEQIVTRESVEWSPRTRRVEAWRREQLGALSLSQERWTDAPPDRLALALGDGVRALGLQALPWSKAALSLRARLQWLAAQPGTTLDLPDWSDQALTDTIGRWLVPHLSGMTRIEQIAGLDLAALLRAELDWSTAAAIDRAAPEHFTTPLGSKLRIDYARTTPTISVRVQEMFGTARHPMIGAPPMALLVELLSPAQRPVQSTADLPGFWRTSYRDVQKDMRARYPRHPWPDDPATATPTKRTKSAQKRSDTKN